MPLLVERNSGFARMAVLLSLLLLVGFVAPKRAEATTNASERQMASLINHARTSHSRAALSLNSSLSDYARRWSATMASKNRLYHNANLATWLRNWNWRILGENVGVGGSVSQLHVAFMNSPPHRANILDRRFRNVGVGVVVRNGRTWVTVIFRG
jgi:uncharacterized protein YkwD